MLWLAAQYFNPAAGKRLVVASQKLKPAICDGGCAPNPTLSVTPGVPSLTCSLWICFAHRNGRKARIPYQIRSESRSGCRLRPGRHRLETAQRRTRSTTRLLLCISKFGGLTLRRKDSRGQVNLLSNGLRWARYRDPILIWPDRVFEGVRSNQYCGRSGRQTRAALAAAIGIPVTALRGVEFSWSNLTHRQALNLCHHNKSSGTPW